MNKRDIIRAELKARYPTLTKVPPKLPAARKADPTAIILGRDGQGRPVPLPLKERLEHVFMLGGSGSGKSRYLLHHMRQTIRIGEGLLFLDPHGNHPDSGYKSLVVELKSTTARVHLIDFEASRVVGFNPLACPLGTDVSVIVGNVMDALAITWEGESFSQKPTIERNLSAILAALVELKLTLCEAPYLLDHKDAHGLRRYALDHVKTTSTLGELRRLDELARDGRRRRDFDQEVVGSINRLERLLRPPAIRMMLGQTENCLDLNAAMDGGDIVLANLSAGAQVYEKDVDLFGRLLTRTALFHAKRRENMHPFNLVLDEAHRFLSSDIPVLLAEIRKYGISIVAGMQWLAQASTYDENILAALLKGTNCKICFRLNDAEEAEQIAHSLIPLNLERPVRALVKPTVVGHRRINLANESESEQQSVTDSHAKTRGETKGLSETEDESVAYTHAETDGGSDVETATDMHSTSEGSSDGSGESSTDIMIPTADPANPTISRVAAGTSTSTGHSSSKSAGTATSKGKVVSHGTMDSESHAFSRATTRSRAVTTAETAGRATTQGTGRSKGQSEALEPILKNLPTAVHSMQNELYAAGRLLCSLPTAVGYLSYVGKAGPVATLFMVPPVCTPNITAEAFATLRDGLLQNALPTAAALKVITDREQEILSRSPPARPQRKPKAPKPDDEGW